MIDYGNWQVVLMIGIFLILLIILILFILTLQKTLEAIEPHNRSIEPRTVWVLLVPVINFFFMFMIINIIAYRGKAQLEQYGLHSNHKPAYIPGLAWMICLLFNWIPAVSIVTTVASFVFFILYWIKVNELRKQLISLKQLHEDKEGSIL